MDVFKFPQNIGILGGDQQNRMAHYFIGEITKKEKNVASTELMYLDPHIIQNVIPELNNLQDCESYHSQKL